MVQRLLFHYSRQEFVDDEHGDYVTYEDYAALEVKLKSLEEAYAQLQEAYDLEVNPECK